MDGTKKKVVVQNAEDYYHILPIRPSESSQRNDQTFQNTSCSTTGATATATLCSICLNNGPSSSSHNCAISKKSEDNFKVPTVLKKRRGKKKENVTRNFSIQIEGTNNTSDNAKIADVTKKPTRRSAGKAVRKECSKQQNSDDNDLTFFGQCGLKPVNSGLSYSDSVKEAIVMDLLDKRYGNLIEEKLSIEIERDINENNFSASGSTGSLLNVAKIKVLESSPNKVSDLGDTEIKEEKFDLYFDVQKCMETIEILDSPDKNCTLFSRQELNFLPDKIFDSPLKPRIKEESRSPIGELCELLKSPDHDPNCTLDTSQMINTNWDEKGSLEVQTTIPHTPEDDPKENISNTCRLTPEVSVGLDNEAKEIEISVKVENLAPSSDPNIEAQTQNDVSCTQNVSDGAYTASLKQSSLGVSETGNVESKSIEEIEISGEFEENIFGDETYRQLISSIVENGPFPDIAKDLAIGTNEEAASNTKERSCEVVEKPREEQPEDSCKKIWEMDAHDISFDALKETFSQRKPQSLDLAIVDDMTNGFHGFANSSGHEKCFGNLPRTASQESLGATSAESEMLSKSIPQIKKKNVKSAGTTEAIINLVRHEVVSQSEKVMIIPSLSDPNSDEDVLHFAHDNCVVETIVTTEGCSDLPKSDQEGIEDIDDVPLIMPPDNTEPVASEPLNENSGEDIDKYDILVLKEDGKFEPLDGEEGSRKTYLEEHCYCSQVFEKVSVVKVESNLEYCGPPNDQSEEHSSSNTAVVGENNVESVPEDIAPSIDTLDFVDQEQCNIVDQLVDDAPQLFPENLVDETGGKYVVKTDFELAELKNRIMEGNINKEEILEIIESKNIVQYNINVAIPENNLLEQQKREAKHLCTCLKKQIDVMKQTYEYFEEIVDSSVTLLEGNVTEPHVKSIFESLHFVKDIVDKTFAYYNTGKNKENKIRYKVISISRKDSKDKQNQKNMSTGTCKKGGKKRKSNKLLPKMLYRMNRLLNCLETYGNSGSKNEQNSFITKLREIARKDFSKLQEMRKRKVLKASRKREPYVLEDESCYTLLEEQRVLSSIENVRENVTRSDVDSCKPVITPLSQDVKIILSQIEQLNKERKTTEEIHRKMLEARCRKTSRTSVENTTQERLVIKPGRQDEVILVEATSPDKAAEKEILTAVPKRSQSIRRRQSKKENVITCETHADSQWGDVSDGSVRHSRRLRKQTDFYSAEKYSTKVLKPSFEVDSSNIKSSRRALNRRNLMYDFENKKAPMVVLYEETKGNKNSFDKTDTPNRMNVETDFKITKRSSRKDPDPTATRMELRSSGKKKSAMKA